MSKTIRILICDDDPIVHQSLSLYLDNEDFLHDSAYDGRQALDMIKKEHYDLMLLDQMMPGMTGMEVCQAVRKDSQLPIIMLTARGEEIDRILGLEMGADDYIVKPFSPREVVSRIKAVLRRTCAAPDTAQDEKLYRREALRLEMSLKDAARIANGRPIFAMMHYPPLLPETARQGTEFTRLLSEYGVKRCVYGHLHGQSVQRGFSGSYRGVRYDLVSCDALGFALKDVSLEAAEG